MVRGEIFVLPYYGDAAKIHVGAVCRSSKDVQRLNEEGVKVELLVSEGEVEKGKMCACLSRKSKCLAGGGFYGHVLGVCSARLAAVHFDLPSSFQHYRRHLTFF